MPLIPRQLRVQPYFGYRNGSRLTISARALRNPAPKWRQRSTLAKMRELLTSFASREQPGADVRLHLKSPAGDTTTHAGIADGEGFVHFDVAIDDWAAPAHTAWETVTLEWDTRDGREDITGYVLAPGEQAALAVISDIDDTILESGVTGGVRAIVRNWRRFLAQMPDERIAVPGADTLYGTLSGGQASEPGHEVPATHHPFFYVSSSPWNLFSFLVAFMKERGLPLGPIHLRDWGLNADTFGSSSHGGHKRAQIETILGFYPALRFALIGDDTQADLVAFGKIAAEHPERIAAIFIRRAGEALNAEELAAKAAIEASAIPFWMGESYEIGHEFLARIGLDHDGEAERIVDTVEEAHKRDTA